MSDHPRMPLPSGADVLASHLMGGLYLRAQRPDGKWVLVYYSVPNGKWAVEHLFWEPNGDLLRHYYVSLHWVFERHPYLRDSNLQQELTPIPYRDSDPINQDRQ